jgi:hypothetical protein
MPDFKIYVDVGGPMKFETEQRNNRYDNYDSGRDRVYRTPQRRVGTARVPTQWLRRGLHVSEITRTSHILHQSDSLTAPREQLYACALVPVLHT